ncbi:MAG: antitoxin Xre-like helix-turn-helix domain-containing protein [Pseudomonadota bacterium]
MMQTLKKPQVSNANRRNAIALKAFFGITQKWGLTSEQERILLGASRTTFYRWKQYRDGTLPADTIERISYVLGIYKALRILLPNEAAANAWISKPNMAILFNGHSALEKLMQGRVIDLADVRRYLDAERG